VIVTSLDELTDFRGDSHNPILALLVNVLRRVERSQPRQEILLRQLTIILKKDAHSFISACTIFAAVACAMIELSIIRNLARTRST
jgi:hypothetical protein